MKKLAAFIAVVLLLASCRQAEPLRVMSFNVRYPNEKDGENYWDHRRDIAVSLLRAYNPDLVGTQELFHRQGEYLVAHLPEYSWFGVSRRGNREDEHMGVFYKQARLRLVESGNFWLSETPDVPGSSSWDMSLPRLVTWAIFELTDSGRRFRYFNTHFAHRRQDAEARLGSAEVILDRLPDDLPFLMTGDFNAPAGGKVHALLKTKLEDLWETAPKTEGPEGTFHGFTGTPGERRIDWILFSGPWRPHSAAAVTFNQDGRYPSDHFPIFAVLEL